MSIDNPIVNERVRELETNYKHIDKQLISMSTKIDKVSEKVTMFIYIGIGLALASGIMSPRIADFLSAAFGVA